MNSKELLKSTSFSIETCNLSVSGITKRIECEPILKKIDFSVRAGEIVAIMGPNGCGKTTFLKILAGLETYDNGSIQFKVNNNHYHPRIGFVFQNAHLSLYPWQTVEKHFLFGLSNLMLSLDEQMLRVHQMLKLLGLQECKNLYPAQLSGGLAQLTAIGRALIAKPDIVLFDEA